MLEQPVNFIYGVIEGDFCYPLSIRDFETFLRKFLNINPTSQNAFFYLYRRFGVSTQPYDEEKSLAEYYFYTQDKSVKISIMVQALDIHITFLVSKELNQEIKKEWRKYSQAIIQSVHEYASEKYNMPVMPMSCFGLQSYEIHAVKDGFEYFFANEKNYNIMVEIFQKYCKDKVIQEDTEDEIFWGDDFEKYCSEKFLKVANELYPNFENTKTGIWWNYNESDLVSNKIFIDFFEANKDVYPNIYKILNIGFAFKDFMQESVNVRDVSFDLWGAKPQK